MPNLCLKFILKNGFDTKKMGVLESSVQKKLGPNSLLSKEKKPQVGAPVPGAGTRQVLHPSASSGKQGFNELQDMPTI